MFGENHFLYIIHKGYHGEEIMMEKSTWNSVQHGDDVLANKPHSPKKRNRDSYVLSHSSCYYLIAWKISYWYFFVEEKCGLNELEVMWTTFKNMWHAGRKLKLLGIHILFYAEIHTQSTESTITCYLADLRLDVYIVWKNLVHILVDVQDALIYEVGLYLKLFCIYTILARGVIMHFALIMLQLCTKDQIGVFEH